MSLLSKDLPRNIELSFQKFFYERLSTSYYINYSAGRDETLQKRIADKVADYWKWIELHWLELGEAIFSISRLQINICTLIGNDPLKTDLRKARDDVINQLNENEVALLDFSTDPENPTVTDNVLIPRFRGARPLSDTAQDTTQVFAVDYNIYAYKESVLP